MDAHELAVQMRKEYPNLDPGAAERIAKRRLAAGWKPGMDERQGKFFDSQVPDRKVSRWGGPTADASQQMREGGENPFDRGERDKGEPRPKPGPAGRGKKKPRVRLFPTNSERLNRGLVELSDGAFKVHSLLWKWRGAPAKGDLAFFTLKSVARFCGQSRNAVRRHMGEMTSKGWVERKGYDPHKKNELYRLIPIEEVPKPTL